MRQAWRNLLWCPLTLRTFSTMLLAVSLAPLAVSQGAGEGKIVSPVDGAAFRGGSISVICRSAGGRIELDGEAVEARQVFPDVLHTQISPAPGEHTLALVLEGGRREVRFFVGNNPPEPYRAFLKHPPDQVECTLCHGLSRRGRFRFKGGCFACHQKELFVDVHQHEAHVLEQCGMCHNAHGSTVKAHLIFAKEIACKQCHN